MAAVVYTLCAMAAFACAVLLLRGYRTSGARLLLWSSLCFAFLGLNNILVTVDLIVFPQLDLFVMRNVTSLAGLALLLYGLVWEAD